MARRRPSEPTVNPARGAALVVIAVVIGLLLLRNGLDTSEVVTASKGNSSGKTNGSGSDKSTTTTTTPLRAPAKVTVVVLNGTSVGGAAGKYSAALATAGYQMLKAGDAATKIPATQVFYTPGFEREAGAVALAAGAPATLTPAALPTPPPGEVGAANVVVVIGTDLASLTPTTAAGATTTTPTTAAAN
ncbi:MAG: LytR C-terminal domain-containing protein [Microthrixaceae bacterium]